jgi:D-beta-D-heptose 7-phosphate kinase/D-beta-D-heptose 1-phosphate adenosyltransferase
LDRFFEPHKLAPLLKSRRDNGQKVVFTNGVFDLLHAGHVTYLQAARAMGDLLVVALNTDESVRRIKGPLKPLIPLAERAEMLLALSCVDYVTAFPEDDPYQIIRTLRPDLLVKGADWAPEKVIGRDLVESWGGRVVNVELVPGRSTTNLIETVRQRFGPS